MGSSADTTSDSDDQDDTPTDTQRGESSSPLATGWSSAGSDPTEGVARQRRTPLAGEWEGL